MLFDEIQSKIWGLSTSAGISPFTFLHFEIDDAIKSTISTDYLNGYTRGIAFFLWDNYSVEDYRDYLSLSKQCLMMDDEQHRVNFLHVQAAKMMEDNESFLQWQQSQIFIALGSALNEIRAKGLAFKDVGPNNITLFERSLKLKDGLLKEVILF